MEIRLQQGVIGAVHAPASYTQLNFPQRLLLSMSQSVFSIVDAYD